MSYVEGPLLIRRESIGTDSAISFFGVDFGIIPGKTAADYEPLV